MELKEAISKRRSVRKFTDYHVTDREIKELMEAARLAPSWANTQVWEFIIVRDKKLIEKVVSTYSEMNPARNCSMAASVLIVACAKSDKSGCKGGLPATKFSEWFMFDLGIAVQNICLRAHEMGLGSVIVGLMDHDSCAKHLSLPAGYEVVAVIPIGKPSDPGKEGPPRKDLQSFVHFEKFGTPFVK